MIPFNFFAGTNYQSSSMDVIKKFSQVLIQSGFVVTIRATRGQDIDAACGQLAGKVKDITSRSRRYAAQTSNIT